MIIIAVDDETLALRNMERAIRNALPEASLSCFNTPGKAIAYARDNPPDIAFLDIEMCVMNGLELAKHLKEICGRTNIVFITGHSHYAAASYAVPASGYIIKPVSDQDILGAMKHLRNPLPKADKKLRVQCFGNFDAFVDGEQLHFSRSKAKELFAFLIHKKGTSCSTREITALLFEDKEDNSSLQRQTQTLISTMMRVLSDAGVRDVIIKNFNSLAVDTAKIDCDYYRFLAWDADAVNQYTGEYMSNYSWAEFTIGYLDSRVGSAGLPG